MRRICDKDFGGEEYTGKCKSKGEYKFIILDNSGSIALFGDEGKRYLPKTEKLVEDIKIDNVIAELNDLLTTIEEIRSEDKLKKEIKVYIAKASVKDDVKVKWVTPEEALKTISVYKRNIALEDYDRKFEILEDENALRDYIIKYIY